MLAIWKHLLLWFAVGAMCPAGSYASRIQLGILGSLNATHPMAAKSEAERYLQELVQRRLTRLNAQGQWRCDLCRNIPTIENAQARILTDTPKKRLLTTWNIRLGSEWGDGQPITGDDVRFSWLLSKRLGYGNSIPLVNSIEEVSIDPGNRQRFHVQFKGVRGDYRQIGKLPLVPVHLEGRIWERATKEEDPYSARSLYRIAPTHPGLYSGPFQISRKKPLLLRKRVSGEQRDWRAPVLIEVTPFATVKSLRASLRRGRLHVVAEAGLSEVVVQDLRYQARISTDYELKSVPGNFVELVLLNLRNPVLADRTVRRAISASIDRSDLLRGLTVRPVRAATQLFYRQTSQRLQMSAEEAQRELSQSGWRLKADGRRYRNGVPLELELMESNGRPFRQLLAERLQSQLARVGISLLRGRKLRMSDFRKRLQRIVYPGLALVAWGVSSHQLPSRALHSSATPTFQNGYEGQNFTAWSNVDADAAMENHLREVNALKRSLLVGQVQRQISSDLPLVPLFRHNRYAVVGSSLDGFHLSEHTGSARSAPTWRLLRGNGFVAVGATDLIAPQRLY